MTILKEDTTVNTGFKSTIIYVVVWFLILLFPLTNELVDTGSAFTWSNIFEWWIGTIPFLVIFLLHHLVLIPKLFLKKKQFTYLAIVVLVVSAFGTYEYYEFKHMEQMRIQEAIITGTQLPLPPPNPSLIPRPVTTQIILLMLMLASNLLIVIRDRYYNEQRRINELESIRLQDELKYLKTQVNPHFFMNMLNNIHGMVEVNASTAQDMILELSKLMRYVLYEGKNPTVTFENEVSFINSYIVLMRRRFPEEKVSIRFDASSDYPKEVLLPPLLFITFLENSFKHGISYRHKSVIKASLEYKQGQIVFCCHNTKPELHHTGQGGVGLSNVKRRLDLLFGNEYELSLDDGPSEYNVKLIIPCMK